MKKFLLTLFTSLIVGGGIWILISGIMMKTSSQEHLAEAQMTRMASDISNNKNDPQVNIIPSDEWKPVALDLDKATEYGLTIVERKPWFPESWGKTYIFFNYSKTSWSIFLWREELTHGYSIVNDNGKLEVVKFSGIACGLAYTWPQENGPYFIYANDGIMLSHGVWDIVGPEDKVKEFISYTKFSLKNNPLCQITGSAPNVNSNPGDSSESIYPWSGASRLIPSFFDEMLDRKTP